VCGESGAAIRCCLRGCEHSFHLPCAREGQCITHYFPDYCSPCWEHSPKQAVEGTPENTDTCIICWEPLENRTSFITMVCPACRNAWFHRAFIQ
ncbi:G2E3 ligase, partial [Bucco capensis]|nr:G2E3 ligase [Bucco capensis]